MLLANDFASDPRVEKEAVALIAHGWEVTVIAWDRPGSLPAAEERQGIQVRRLGPRAPYGGGIRSAPRFRAFWQGAAAAAVELRPDVVHCHDLDTAEAGLAVLKAMRTRPPRLVLDFHELYRESKMVPQKGLLGVLARAAVRVVERRSITAADAVLLANPGARSAYDRFGLADTFVTVENAPDLDRFHPSARTRSAGDPFRVCFIGQKRYTQGLYTLMEAVTRQPDMSALLAGGGVAAADVEVAARQRYQRVETVGRLDYADIPARYEGCDAVYAVYDSRLGNVRTLFPVKVMEGMACALPVLVAEGTWIADYVVEHGIGFAVPDDDVGAVETALRRLADHPDLAAEMGRRGREIVESELNWAAAAERLVGAYERIMSRPVGPSAG